MRRSEPGQKFGRLTTVNTVTGKKPSGRPETKWFCLCACGNTSTVSLYDLKNGKVSSCGCYKKERNREELGAKLAGKKFTKLQVQEALEQSYNNKIIWRCLCDCGSYVNVPTDALTSGNTKSCGCLHAQSMKNKNWSEANFKKQQTMMYRYGYKYTSQVPEFALKMALSQKSNYQAVNWETGEIVVCQSSYERRVVEYLNINKIRYESQIPFKLPALNCTYFVDFFLPDSNTYIEVKGYKREDGMIKYEEFKKYYNIELWEKDKIAAIKHPSKRDISFPVYWTWDELVKIRTSTELASYPGMHFFPHEHSRVSDYVQSKHELTDKYNARDCTIQLVPKEQTGLFLETHIQGGTRRYDAAYGLYSKNNELVALATFARHHRDATKWVLERYVCKRNARVRGGLGKLSQHGCGVYGNLISWADRRFSNGDAYLAAGWKLESVERGDYFYYDPANNAVISKQSRKKQTVGTPEGMTETEHAEMDGLYKIHTLGTLVFTYNKLSS